MKQESRFVHVLVCILCCLMFIGDVSANNPKEEAAILFQQKQYKEALDIWYGLVQSGNTGAGIYYNIGVSESILGQTPKAILAFEKALRFTSSDKKILEAIELERKKIENAVIPVPSFFLSKWIRSALSLLRPGYWAMIGLVNFIVLLFWMIRFKLMLLNKRNARARQVVLLFTAGVFFLLCAWLSYRQIYRTDEAIVVVESIFRQASSDASPSLRTIYPGEKVIVSDQIGDWYQVRLLNLDEGWVKSESLELIIVDGTGPGKQ